MENKRSGGRLLVECLINQGVDTAFGVPGESYLDVLDALYDAQNSIRMIVTRHESGASFAAEAFGKLTGRPGICFVTRGPGATNASIGVHTAAQNSTPMILFVGQIARNMRQREAFQEIDYRSFFGDVAKWVTEIDTLDRMPEIIARAFSETLSGRPGPVVIALPENMLREVSSVAACSKSVIGKSHANPRAISKAVETLKMAKKPLVLVGGGGWNDRGRADLKTFLNKNNLPAIVAFRSQDLVDNATPAYIGDAGVGMSPHVKKMIRDADTILAINIRFGESTTEGWSLLDVPNMTATLIHSHASISEINKIYQADISVPSDPNALMEVLAELPAIGDWNNWQKTGHQAFLDMRASASVQGDVDMVAISKWLDAHLDDDAIITNGAGNFAVWPSKFLTYTGKRRLLAPQSGAMGAGFPAALAAKAVDATRQVICFAGDGDFQMSLAEMGTATQEGLNPIVLVLNNGMYGTIRAHQERDYPNRVSGTNIVNPDFVALARAYGFSAYKVRKTEEFADTFKLAKTSQRGALIELMIDPQDITPFASLNEISAINL